MIVDYNGKSYLVVTICLYEYTNLAHRKSNMLCLSIDDDKFEWIDMPEVSIVDGRLPFGMCVHRRKTENAGRNESYLCIEYDEIFRNETFWGEIDNKKPSAMLCLYQYINEIKALHGLPLIDLSKWEKRLEEEVARNREKMPEEERQEKINTELDEYLLFGTKIVHDGIKVEE
jgi:hypothetical protein